VGSEMTAAVPSVCSSCPHKQDKYQQHDERIVARCRTFRAKYQMVPIYDESGSVIGAAAPEVVP
jgi:hypothetical protein